MLGAYVDSNKRYRILNELGAGGFARVLLCRDRISRQFRAVKVANRMGDESLLREARGLRYLSHPGVVRVHDVGEDESGRLYLVMDYVEGPTLRDFLDQVRKIPAAVAVQLGVEIAEALQAIHAEGFVHRDLNPANVILDRITKRPIVCDFGIARDLGLSTHTGSGAGTLAYMPPEQMRGRATPQSDVFALAVMRTELLIGSTPWGEARTAIVAYRILKLHRRTLARRISEVPEPLKPVLLRAMARTPRERFVSMGAFKRAMLEARVRSRGRSLDQLIDRYYGIKRVCGTCGVDLITHMRHCPHCADKKLLRWNDNYQGRCPRCQWERHASWRYCSWCGTTFNKVKRSQKPPSGSRGKCPSCRGATPIYARFCPHCRERLSWDVDFKIPCPSCNWGVSPRWTGCPWCGRKLKRKSPRQRTTA